LLKGLKHLFVIPVVSWICSVILYCIGDIHVMMSEKNNKVED